jgi:hypothetical protein
MIGQRCQYGMDTIVTQFLLKITGFLGEGVGGGLSLFEMV